MKLKPPERIYRYDIVNHRNSDLVTRPFPALCCARLQGKADRLTEKAYKGLFSALMALSILLMGFGFSGMEFIPVYDPPLWAVHANNLMMLIAVYLFGAGSAKGWISTKIRHPMLTGVMVWSAAHLLANGDLAAVILFGGIGLWALVSVALINRKQSAWEPHEARGKAAEICLVVITLAVFAVIASVHRWGFGVNPFS